MNGSGSIASQVESLVERGLVVQFNEGTEQVVINFGAVGSAELMGELQAP